MATISYERVELHLPPFAEGVPAGFWENRIEKREHPELKALYILPARDEAARLAAEKILETVSQKPDAAISFPTGSQAKSVYDQLALLAKERDVSFAEVRAFHLDEYFPITADHPDSFRKYLRENVWEPLGLQPENIHEIPTDPGNNGHEVAAAYEALLNDTEIDLVFHPIGCGGHMGFNESGTPKDSATHLADLSGETIYRDQVIRKQSSPNQAITQGIATVLRAKHILFIDLDPGYKYVMRDALYGPVTEQNPSSLLRTEGHKVEAITTREIAAQFPQPHSA